jgi:hypothetical protein
MEKELEPDVLLQFINKIIERKPSFAGKVIDCVTYSLLKAEERQAEELTKKDKALLILFEKSYYGNEKNLEDVAEVLTDSRFNGTGKKYTAEDVKKVISEGD